MEKIAIAGLGWLGLPLGLELQSLGYKVLGTTTNADKISDLQEKGFEAALLDLNKEFDREGLRTFFEEVSVCIINIPPGKSVFQSYRSQCLELAGLFPETARFIFTSSTSVYSDRVILAEENTSVLTDYNFTSQLFLAEKALKTELGQRLTVLRLAGLFGENRNPARHLSGKSGLKNPASPVNLVHRDDCIAFIKEIIRQRTWGETFNVCASEHPSREEFYTRICEKQGWELPFFDPESQEQGKIVSNQKGIQMLGFSYRLDSPFDF
ncbi:MAG: family NAD(P)-dependent oxidoreductase [Crocinitomicaceae bacterium]|jgi:nucleoside-diphosphate-sugar epimerase|nr:family NAD(P)-dependent oxidoreductase [Crocinitomicaceae bacterium]